MTFPSWSPINYQELAAACQGSRFPPKGHRPQSRGRGRCPAVAASLSPSPVEGGASLGLQLLPEAEAVGHHAGVVVLGVGAADDAALPMRAAPRVGQEELWGREDTGVTTGTATFNPTGPVCTSAVPHRAPWDTACPVNHGTGKQQETGVLVLGT